MKDSAVPVIVIAGRQDDVEFINRTLRDAGHPVRCIWIKRLDKLEEALLRAEPQLILFFADKAPAKTREIAKLRQLSAQMVPLVVVRQAADEAAISDAMRDGAQDLVSIQHPSRVCAVAEREMRAFRLERALNETLSSATQYKKQLRAFMAGSADAIAQVQEGIVVEANQAWADLFSQSTVEDALGPLMDYFSGPSQAALKGALIASDKGQWDGEPLKVEAMAPDGSTVGVALHLEKSVYDGEPATRLSVPRQPSRAAAPEELVDRAVHTDPATGFYHRQRFIELLTDRLDDRSHGGARALAFVRPDKFSEIEDEVGPVASEEILIQLADLLKRLAHERDLCGRFGGNVFTLAIERGTLRDIEAWAEHAVSRIADQIFEVAEQTLSLSCTIGIAEMGPGTDRVEDLIRDAERANQRGRKRGGNQAVLEETSDQSTRIKRFDALWVHQLKSALVENRFRLVHLSIANLGGKSGKIYDTVLRLVDQQGEEAAASEFMGAARRNKLLRPIDRWVVAASLEYCKRQEFDFVFVKLSHESVIDPSLPDWIDMQVRESGIPPARLCFQISEEDATQYLKQTNALAERLRRSGFRFAIEHFGIGRDPLKILNQTPMNFVKLDGSLMQSIAEDAALQDKVGNFVKAAAKRKIETVAERVENANTMAVLFQLGVGYMQGHYLHEPDVVLEDIG